MELENFKTKVVPLVVSDQGNRLPSGMLITLGMIVLPVGATLLMWEALFVSTFGGPTVAQKLIRKLLRRSTNTKLSACSQEWTWIDS